MAVVGKPTQYFSFRGCCFLFLNVVVGETKVVVFLFFLITSFACWGEVGQSR